MFCVPLYFLVEKWTILTPWRPPEPQCVPEQLYWHVLYLAARFLGEKGPHTFGSYRIALNNLTVATASVWLNVRGGLNQLSSCPAAVTFCYFCKEINKWRTQGTKKYFLGLLTSILPGKHRCNPHENINNLLTMPPQTKHTAEWSFYEYSQPVPRLRRALGLDFHFLSFWWTQGPKDSIFGFFGTLDLIFAGTKTATTPWTSMFFITVISIIIIIIFVRIDNSNSKSSAKGRQNCWWELLLLEITNLTQIITIITQIMFPENQQTYS